MRKPDRQAARRTVAKLRKISQPEDPRSMDRGPTENKSGPWRYRIGDYRIVADIEGGVPSSSQRMSTAAAGHTSGDRAVAGDGNGGEIRHRDSPFETPCCYRDRQDPIRIVTRIHLLADMPDDGHGRQTAGVRESK